MRRIVITFIAITVAGMTAMLTALVTPAFASGPSLAGVEAALATSPVYLDPAAGGPHVDAQRLLAVIPKGTYFAALPASDVAATGDPAALPALLSSQLGKGGTVIVLVGSKLYGSSTTVPGRLGDELGSAQSALPATGDATGALVALMQSLSGSAALADAPGPSHAGGPVGPALLIVMAIALAVGALALWWWLRRPPSRQRRRKPRRVQPMRDLVEIDHEGNIVKRTPASERRR